jgi:hypothetical protein
MKLRDVAEKVPVTIALSNICGVYKDERGTENLSFRSR